VDRDPDHLGARFDSGGKAGRDWLRRDGVRPRHLWASVQVSEARPVRSGLIEPEELEILVPVDLEDVVLVA
jgi:hypothetical protein